MRLREERRYRDRQAADIRMLGIRLNLFLQVQLNMMEKLMFDIARLARIAEADTSATNAAVTVINELNEAMRAAVDGGDPAETNRLLDLIEANTQKLAAAITKKTGAEGDSTGEVPPTGGDAG